jgi:hypothetical protein
MDTPNLNISSASYNDTLFQLYCLDPPLDSCELGPCPNPDVTGVGQQLSCMLRLSQNLRTRTDIDWFSVHHINGVR